jgi:hypothetical protein
MSEIRFDDITPIEVEVFVGKEKYILRETSGAARVIYDNARLACYEYQEGKLVKVHDMANIEVLLVSLCLFMGDGVTPVSEISIKVWPGRVYKALYEKAREISGMSETPENLEEQIKLLQKQLSEYRDKDDTLKN